MRLLWLGPVRTTSLGAASPAADWWNSRMVESLREIGVDVVSIGHVPFAAWPRGQSRVLPSSPTGSHTTHVGYLNVPGLRSWSLARSYRRLASRVLDEVDAVVTYNPYPYHLRVAADARSRHKTWACVFADRVDRPSRWGSGRHNVLNNPRATCDLAVNLSWRDHIEHAGTASLHLDGGVDPSPVESARSGQPTVLYTGALNQHAGVDLLIESIPHMRVPATVWICGKGDAAWVSEMVRERGLGSRVVVHGYVDDERLEDLSARAWCFANPRPSSVANQHNFPSKVLRYLSYGKPIASTRTPGLAPGYEDVLTFSDEPEPTAFARAIDHALELERVDPDRLRDFTSGRSWHSQAVRFSDALTRVLSREADDPNTALGGRG